MDPNEGESHGMSGLDPEVAAELANINHGRQRYTAAQQCWELLPIGSAYQSDSPAWRDLDSWVSWLVETYEFGRFSWPACWHNHGGFVQELAALRLEHAAIIADQDAAALVAWHSHIDHLRERADHIATRCQWDKRCTKAPAVDDTPSLSPEAAQRDAEVKAQLAAWFPPREDSSS